MPDVNPKDCQHIYVYAGTKRYNDHNEYIRMVCQFCLKPTSVRFP